MSEFTKNFRSLIELSRHHLFKNKIGRLRTLGTEACDEIDRLTAENEQLNRTVDRLREKNLENDQQIRQLEAENEQLRGFVLSARHDAGCNYEYGKAYGCKCGLLELQESLKED